MLFFLGKQLLSRVRETQVITDVVISGSLSEERGWGLMELRPRPLRRHCVPTSSSWGE